MKRNMKRLVVLILTVILVTGMITGCGGKTGKVEPGTDVADGSGQTTEEEINLSFWCSALYTPEETKKPQEEWMISKQ